MAGCDRHVLESLALNGELGVVKTRLAMLESAEVVRRFATARRTGAP
jgi:hypothetical protein